MVPAADPETVPHPCMDSAIVLFGLGLANSTIHQGIQEEYSPTVPWVIGLHTLVPAVGLAVTYYPAPDLLRHGVGATRGKSTKHGLIVESETAL